MEEADYALLRADENNLLKTICEAMIIEQKLLHSFDDLNLCFRLAGMLEFIEPTMLSVKETFFYQYPLDGYVSFSFMLL